MKLIPVKGNPDAAPFLYELLSERPQENFISHETMPTYGEHEVFVAEHPFRYWYLLETEDRYVGALEVTDRNEIGVAILKREQGKGYGSLALRTFISGHIPLPPVKAVRNGHWLANIAADNNGSKLFFKRMGFRKLQETYVRD